MAALAPATTAGAAASGSSSPREAHAALPLGKPGASAKGVAAAPGSQTLVPELAEGDSLRRVMRPAVLGAATLVVGGTVLGVGIALCAGWLT